MALSLYRRHRRDCKAGHPEQLHSSEFDERKRGWKRCECPIVVAGTLNRQFKRQSTGRWEWDDARQLAAAFEAAGSWGNVAPIVPAPPVTESSRKRVAVEHATKVFLEELKETAARATQKKYRLMAGRLNEFGQSHGYIMLDQFEPEHIRAFRSTWAVSPATAVRRMAELKAFFEYCLSNKWVTGNPARAVKNPRTRDASQSQVQKLPFTDEELKKMYDACKQYGGTYRHRWDGTDMEDFISLSIYTGLRISDVALFRVERMLPTGEIRVRTTKAGTHVYTWVPQWLQDRIRARVSKHGDYIFGSHTTESLDVITELQQWPYKKQTLFFYDWMIRDFFAFMLTLPTDVVAVPPGIEDRIPLGDKWQSKCQSAHARAVKACDYEYKDQGYLASEEWQKIFGTQFETDYIDALPALKAWLADLSKTA